MKIVDLHCDLMAYLELGNKRADHPEVRCSWPQLKAGNVHLQVMALYTATGERSTLSFQKQMDCYQNLATLYPSYFAPCSTLTYPPEDGRVHTLAAIENASGLVLEEEAMDLCFRRLDEFLDLCSPVLYVSLTWHTENRFGGGNRTQIGLKPDGKILLEYLSGKQIALDLSHTSDALAYEMLDYIDKRGLDLIPIASHSNFRSICDHPRNLPNDLVAEIVKRGGVIGLNVVRAFIGKHFAEDFVKHMQHAREQGWWDHVCFGADFFCDQDSDLLLPELKPVFIAPYEDASCYPRLLELLSASLTPEQLQQVAHKNAAAFLMRLKEGQYVSSR